MFLRHATTNRKHYLLEARLLTVS